MYFHFGAYVLEYQISLNGFQLYGAINSATNSIDFRNVLKSAGAIVVNERPEGEYIDLSPEALDKSTIIDLMKPER